MEIASVHVIHGNDTLARTMVSCQPPSRLPTVEGVGLHATSILHGRTLALHPNIEVLQVGRADTSLCRLKGR